MNESQKEAVRKNFRAYSGGHDPRMAGYDLEMYIYHLPFHLNSTVWNS